MPGFWLLAYGSLKKKLCDLMHDGVCLIGHLRVVHLQGLVDGLVVRREVAGRRLRQVVGCRSHMHSAMLHGHRRHRHVWMQRRSSRDAMHHVAIHQKASRARCQDPVLEQRAQTSPFLSLGLRATRIVIRTLHTYILNFY